jgi:hypothetical protein
MAGHAGVKAESWELRAEETEAERGAGRGGRVGDPALLYFFFFGVTFFTGLPW